MLGKFIIKVLLNSIVVVPLLLWFSEASFTMAFLTGMALSVIAYFVGDQVILRYSKSNNVATTADAFLSFVFLWMVGSYMDWTLSVSELLIIVALLGVVEYLIHMLMLDDTNKVK
ncbi:DUF2512 family protein [Paenibacillus sedimenti]|uniref:DUF2512 family protein n=1 Tax=Paenibacillus sedimenti TaxID=2770274 RepID=A0A926KUK6_9BACL|nr:DUF2512 family protein [Paenibacillus sedimenti]MBD0383136.1 DUF2512 family protein [Paenibacillus sedimenti]